MNEEITTLESSEALPVEEETAFSENENALDSTDADVSEESKINELNKKIETLSMELEAYKTAKAQQEKIAEQLNEFSELFPNIAIKAVPDEVWENVKKGNTLAASYAVYEKRISEAARRIDEINQRNAYLAAGVAGKNSSNEYYSPDEVRKMSPSEVRANFAKIRKSMETWK